MKAAEIWNVASQQLIRQLRGKRSQLALSKRLGYKGNPVRGWEAGRRYPTALGTLLLAKKVGVDVEAGFRRFHTASELHLVGELAEDNQSLADWLMSLKGSVTVAELARRSGRSRYAIGRWLFGETKPRLPEFLELVDAITGRGSALVAELVDLKAIPALLAIHNKHQAARDLAFEEPWTEAIMRVLETQEYAQLPSYQPGWLSARLQISEETETRCVKRMVEAGIVAIRRGKLVRGANLAIDTGRDPQKVLALKRHWASVGVQRLEEEPRDLDLFAYNAISLSREDLAKIRILLQHSYREIRSIVAATKREEVAALVQIQLINWQE